MESSFQKAGNYNASLGQECVRCEPQVFSADEVLITLVPSLGTAQWKERTNSGKLLSDFYMCRASVPPLPHTHTPKKHLLKKYAI